MKEQRMMREVQLHRVPQSAQFEVPFWHVCCMA